MNPSAEPARERTVSGATDRAPTASTDASLLCRFKRGEQDAATALYLRYAKRLTAFTAKRTSRQLATRFDPEDVIQSVFRTFFRRASDGAFDVPASEELWQLLLVIALNKVRQLGRFHRQQRRDVERTMGGESLAEGNVGASDTSLRMLQLVIDEALEPLPDIQRQMIEMRIQGHSVAEIAELTKRCRRTVERVMRQFRDSISGGLASEGSDADE